MGAVVKSEATDLHQPVKLDRKAYVIFRLFPNPQVDHERGNYQLKVGSWVCAVFCNVAMVTVVRGPTCVSMGARRSCCPSRGVDRGVVAVHDGAVWAVTCGGTGSWNGPQPLAIAVAGRWPLLARLAPARRSPRPLCTKSMLVAFRPAWAAAGDALLTTTNEVAQTDKLALPAYGKTMVFTAPSAKLGWTILHHACV